MNFIITALASFVLGCMAGNKNFRQRVTEFFINCYQKIADIFKG